MADPTKSPQPPSSPVHDDTAMADQPVTSEPTAVPPTLPSADVVVSRLSDLTAIEGNLTSSFEQVSGELQSINTVEQELLKELEQVRQRKDTQRGLVDEAEAVLQSNRTAINRIRAGLGSLFGATAVPDNIAELLAPYEVTKTLLVKLPFKGASTATSSHKSTTTARRKAAKRSRVAGEDDTAESDANGEDEEEYHSAGTNKKRKRSKGDEKEIDKNGLLIWKDTKPPYLNRAQCIVHVIEPPRELTRDDANKLKGKYFSLACPVCHGNYSKGGNTYLRGLNGVAIHLRNVHKEDPQFEKMKEPYLLPHCITRELDEEEIMRIRRQEEYPTVVEAFCESRDNAATGRRSTRTSTRGRRGGRASTSRRATFDNSNIDPDIDPAADSQAFDASVPASAASDALLNAFTQSNDAPASPAARSEGEETTIMPGFEDDNEDVINKK